MTSNPNFLVISDQIFKWIGLFACILSAIAGQADNFPEPYKHWLSIGGVVGTAIYGFYLNRSEHYRS